MITHREETPAAAPVMAPSTGSFPAGCRTTAMSILPHTDLKEALDLVLGLDIPFWPQLPNISFAEDMYAQASYDFPGVVIDHEEGKIKFETAKFDREINDYSRKMADPASFSLDSKYGSIYHKFLELELESYAAVHGQMVGPVNLGFRINDEEGKPIIYSQGTRSLIFDFVQRKYLTQYEQLREKNGNAFVWLDEPGLIWVFSGLSGYNDVQAKSDYAEFLKGIPGLKALHLCTNINLQYLLELGIEFLSFDAYQLETMPKEYAASIGSFINNGGILCWGIVPSDPVILSQETPETIVRRLTGYWEVVSENTDLPVKKIAERALLAPAKCCIKSLEFSSSKQCVPGEVAAATGPTAEQDSVKTAYAYLGTISDTLREKYNLA